MADLLPFTRRERAMQREPERVRQADLRVEQVRAPERLVEALTDARACVVALVANRRRMRALEPEA